MAALLLLASAPVIAADLQIMTVGDSLTFGFEYQPRLKALLESSGHSVTFVGTQSTGANKHEGWSGKAIQQFVNVFSSDRQYIETALDTVWPSAPSGPVPVVLVHVGINNLRHGIGTSSAEFHPQAASGSWIDPLGDITPTMTHSSWLKQQVSLLVDRVLAHPSRPRLVVAKILPIGKGASARQADNDNCCERIKEWNGYWAAKVASVSEPDAARITIVDCYTDAEPKRGYGEVPGDSFWGPESVQQGDWVHPSPVEGGAYTLMATRFKAGIDALLPVTTSRSATWSGETFSEAPASDGTIPTALTVTLTNDTFTGSDGDDLVSGGKVAVSNVPAGLTAVARRTSSTVVTVTLTGAASAHADANDIANLGVTFADSAVAGGAASTVSGLSVTDRTIDFSDPAPTSPGILAWSAATHTVSEGASITLTVSRTGGSTGTVGVAYASTVGTAAASDFTAVGGTLSFAPGQLTRTVTVATTPDALVEGGETFSVTLSSATGGASLGATTTAVITISDATTTPAPSAASVANPASGGKRGCGLGSGFTLLAIALGLAVRSRH